MYDYRSDRPLATEQACGSQLKFHHYQILWKTQKAERWEMTILVLYLIYSGIMVNVKGIPRVNSLKSQT